MDSVVRPPLNLRSVLKAARIATSVARADSGWPTCQPNPSLDSLRCSSFSVGVTMSAASERKARARMTRRKLLFETCRYDGSKLRNLRYHDEESVSSAHVASAAEEQREQARLARSRRDPSPSIPCAAAAAALRQ
jgi:hypothetical protein